MKDTNNLLEYNQWSCGEYKNSQAQNMAWGVKLYKTNEYSSIGEISIKSVYTSPTNGVRFNYNSQLSDKNVTTKLALKTKSKVWVTLREMDNNNEQINNTVSSFQGNGDIELVLTSSNNNDYFQIQVYGIPEDESIFIDNVRLYSS